MLRQLTKAVCDSSVVARESYLLWRPAVQGSFACQVVGPGSPPRWLQRGGLATSAGDSAEKSETKAPESAEVETSSSADEGSTSAAELQVPPPPPSCCISPCPTCESACAAHQKCNATRNISTADQRVALHAQGVSCSLEPSGTRLSTVRLQSGATGQAPCPRTHPALARHLIPNTWLFTCFSERCM